MSRIAHSLTYHDTWYRRAWWNEYENEGGTELLYFRSTSFYSSPILNKMIRFFSSPTLHWRRWVEMKNITRLLLPPLLSSHLSLRRRHYYYHHQHLVKLILNFVESRKQEVGECSSPPHIHFKPYLLFRWRVSGLIHSHSPIPCIKISVMLHIVKPIRLLREFDEMVIEWDGMWAGLGLGVIIPVKRTGKCCNGYRIRISNRLNSDFRESNGFGMVKRLLVLDTRSYSVANIIGIVGGNGKCNVMKFLKKYVEDK